MWFVVDIVAFLVAVKIGVSDVSLLCSVAIFALGGSCSGVVVYIGNDDYH